MNKTYKSPAKVNLNLKVLGKRPDGFHEIETLMARIALNDEIEFSPSDNLELHCDFPGVPTDESNLILRAIRLLEKHTERSFFYRIELRKTIPHGAGLAGGSSNAASTLMALCQLENLKLEQSELVNLAAELGSDIPFFLYGSTCICSGRGEVVIPVAEHYQADLLVVKPHFGVNTPDAYQCWQDSKEVKGINYDAQRAPWGSMKNDLERPVFAKHRFLAELKMWLLSQPEVSAAMMSGSGSTVFAVLKEAGGECESLKKRLRAEIDPSLWIAGTQLT